MGNRKTLAAQLARFLSPVSVAIAPTDMGSAIVLAAFCAVLAAWAGAAAWARRRAMDR